MPVYCQSGIIYNHDATMCQCCWHINHFYTVFQPALARLNKINNCSSSDDDNEVCGILTFLEGCVEFGYITNETKSNITSNDSFDYTPLLDSIVNAQKKFISRPSYSASVRALLYKYKKKTVETYETKPQYEDCPKDCALPCKDEKNPSVINKRKRRASKRHLEHSVKDLTPTLKNKHKIKAVASNKTKLSAPKARKTHKVKSNLKRGTSTVGKKQSKASKLKSKKKVVDKIPAKGTLKRKRWLLKQFETDKNYEDDVFENHPIFQIAQFDEASQSSHDYSKRGGTPTWEFKLSPRPESPLPNFDDSDDIAELQMFRKNAEEYQHERWKRLNSPRRKQPSTSSKRVKKEVKGTQLKFPSAIMPLKNEGYDSDEILDDYMEETEDCSPNS